MSKIACKMKRCPAKVRFASSWVYTSEKNLVRSPFLAICHQDLDITVYMHFHKQDAKLAVKSTFTTKYYSAPENQKEIERIFMVIVSKLINNWTLGDHNSKTLNRSIQETSSLFSLR